MKEISNYSEIRSTILYEYEMKDTDIILYKFFRGLY